MRNRWTALFIAIQMFAAAGIIHFVALPGVSHAATSVDYEAKPPFVSAGVPPLLMLVMGRNHKLYYEAYNDASDLNNDGYLDVGYKPDIEYYGYFDSHKYYQYNSDRFEPVGETADKTAPSGDYWSGDFLNYLSMTRMDCLRKVLYGGYRSTDTATETVLERVFVPQDAHSWGKEYKSIAYDGYDIREYTPLDLPAGASRHLFANTTLSNNGDPLLRVLENSILRIWEWVAIERPVAGSQGNDGSGRRDVTDNDVSGSVVDATNGGSAGLIDDSYSAGTGLLFGDDFNDASIDSSWQFADHDSHTVTSRSEGGGELLIEANGADIWEGSTNDEFASLYRDDVSGDFDFRVRVMDQEDTNGWAKCGIMVRNDMTQAASSSGYCVISVTPDNGFSFQWDDDGNGYLDGNTTGGSPSPPDSWVRLTKEGNLFTAYYSTDGTSWIELESEPLGSANASQDVGLFVTSHTSSEVCSVHFDEMELYGGVEPTPENAFDDNTATAWNYPDEPAAGNDPWIEFQFNSDLEIRSYTMTGGSDAPDSWELMGSNDQTIWDIVDTVSSAGLTDGSTESFDCDNSDIYEYYRFVITDTTDPAADGFSVEEIEMMESTEPIPASATLTDYAVRVAVCDPSVGVETNSKLYPSNVYKPVGILQRHGESDRMYFGLITGSYTNNTSGGVLRKNIGSITDEIAPDTGEFRYQDDASVDGIIKTIDLFRIVDFNYGSYSYDSDCGWETTRPINEGECRMWGNPTAEMMYESLRYFSGAGSPTPEFTYGTGGNDDNDLGLPKPGWVDPYDEDNGYDYCAKPFMLVLSDIYPTYDSDQLPGSAFGTVGSTLSDLNVSSLAGTISSEEGGFGNRFIGESGGTYDGSCSPKSVTGLGNIRGLCPEEPTKQGSYYAASVSYYGNTQDIHSAAQENQNVGTYCVGLASPLPEINIEVGDSIITLVPFGKSVGGGGWSISPSQGDFQPTNTIVDFFVEEISPTYGKFRINFEDVEQGADHDMDAIVEYEYQVIDSSGAPVADPTNGSQVVVSLDSKYAAGTMIQHMGYIVSGSTQDGTYLEVRDYDTGTGSDPDYFLDTPPGELPGGNWNDNTALPVTATRTFSPGDTAAGIMTNPLWYASKWGGFEDYNDSNTPDETGEWDNDGDGDPDTYFYVQNPLRLQEQLNKSFEMILAETSSGTAASVISQTRSGEGAVYQAIFFPEYRDTVKWTGDVRSLFVDSHGNMREDTNGNRVLDPDQDLIVVFDGTVVEKYEDANANYILDPGEHVATSSMDEVQFLWTASEWLNEMGDTEAIAQRVNYSDTSDNRFIFTFVDSDADMVVDSGEQQPFVYPSTDPTDLTDDTTIFPYINLFPTFGDEPSVSYNGVNVSIGTLRGFPTVFDDFLYNQTKRVINYVRGEDQDQFTSGTSPAYVLPAFRNRQVDYDEDGDVETWRLGDIVYSTPTAVGRPSEGYHLLYRDHSYGDFLRSFQKRRTVVYAGANDGMFHAFNAGFFDSATNEFKLSNNGEAEYALGQELWAYVPYNLLPHLSWLTEANYPHVYYCDLKPKVFDAKILPDGTHDSGDGQPDWGTFLIGGMRMGGGEITADMDKTDGSSEVPDVDRTMTSAYFILDITDPESPPTVIAELSFDGLGYTTCFPAIAPMKDKDTSGINQNEWYLVFGSGPADGSGSAGTYDSLADVRSQQEGKLFVVDLKELALNGTLQTLDSSGSFTAAPTGTDYYQNLDSNSFISDPISVDYNLDYNADVVYFGTVQGDSSTGWGGKLRRITMDNDYTAASWGGDSTLLDLTGAGQPITAAPSAAMDNRGKRWVYFGTGRFFVNSDKENMDQQTYYGIKEPFNDTNGNGYMETTESLSWNEVVHADLLDVTNAEVHDNHDVLNVSGASTWEDLINTMDSSATPGWYLDFNEPAAVAKPGGERNLGQAALLGKILTFTTYIPSSDKCTAAGESNLYAVYYKTGTAYFADVIGSTDVGTGNVQSLDKVSHLGGGMTISPSIHVGSEEGSKAFVQTSKGDIKVIQELNPQQPKSGVRSWREMQ